MKKLLLIILLLSGCGEKKDESFKCAATIPADLIGLQIGDDVSTKNLFIHTTPQTFVSGNYCSKTFIFNQFNETNYDWCYYYSIETTCDGIVNNIFNGGN